MSAINKRVMAMASLSLFLVVAAMFRDHVVLNTGGSVPVGFCIAVDPADAEYVTFCLPPLPASIRHDPSLCTWSQPRGRPVLKRLFSTTRLGLHLGGDSTNALDSRQFGPSPVELVQGFWRPVLKFDHAFARTRDSDHSVPAPHQLLQRSSQHSKYAG